MPQHLIAPPIRTERLLLRAYRRDDFRHLVAIYQTERSRYIGGPLSEMQVWQGFMNTIGHWPVMGFGAWAIELSATGACIGEVAITQPPNYPETELGWVLFGDHEGQGYALEAATAALAFARQLGLASLVSYVDPDNHRSARLAERLGAVRDPAAATPNGDPCLVFRYALA